MPFAPIARDGHRVGKIRNDVGNAVLAAANSQTTLADATVARRRSHELWAGPSAAPSVRDRSAYPAASRAASCTARENESSGGQRHRDRGSPRGMKPAKNDGSISPAEPRQDQFRQTRNSPPVLSNNRFSNGGRPGKTETAWQSAMSKKRPSTAIRPDDGLGDQKRLAPQLAENRHSCRPVKKEEAKQEPFEGSDLSFRSPCGIRFRPASNPATKAPSRHREPCLLGDHTVGK